MARPSRWNKLHALRTRIETKLDQLSEKVGYNLTSDITGHSVVPLYNSDMIQIGWWIVFDLKEHFCLGVEELVSIKEGLQAVLNVKSVFVSHSPTGPSVWVGVHLDEIGR